MSAFQIVVWGFFALGILGVCIAFTKLAIDYRRHLREEQEHERIMSEMRDRVFEQHEAKRIKKEESDRLIAKRQLDRMNYREYTDAIKAEEIMAALEREQNVKG